MSCFASVGEPSCSTAVGSARSRVEKRRAANRTTRCCATASIIPDARSPELAEGLSKTLGKPINAGAVRVLIHRAREEFADILLREVTDSLTDTSLDEAEQELIDLGLLEYCRPALDRLREQNED